MKCKFLKFLLDKTPGEAFACAMDEALPGFSPPDPQNGKVWTWVFQAAPLSPDPTQTSLPLQGPLQGLSIFNRDFLTHPLIGMAPPLRATDLQTAANRTHPRLTLHLMCSIE